MLTSLTILELEFKSPQSCLEQESQHSFPPTIVPTLRSFWFKYCTIYMDSTSTAPCMHIFNVQHSTISTHTYFVMFLALSWCRTPTCTYIPLLFVPLACFSIHTGLTSAVATILILSSYWPNASTLAYIMPTFLFCLCFPCYLQLLTDPPLWLISIVSCTCKSVSKLLTHSLLLLT